MAAKILVTGDVVLDVNLYAGWRMTPDSDERGTHVQKTPGGAMITWSLLRELAGKKPDPRLIADALHTEDLVFGLKESTVETSGVLAGRVPRVHFVGSGGNSRG